MEGLIECLTAMEENWSVQEPGHRLIDEIAGARKASQKQHEQRKIASLGVSSFFFLIIPELYISLLLQHSDVVVLVMSCSSCHLPFSGSSSDFQGRL
jgi:hypothetical protein